MSAKLYIVQNKAEIQTELGGTQRITHTTVLKTTLSRQWFNSHQ